MKSSDIAMIVLVAGCSIGVSADYTEPSKEIFNKQAINPTVQSSIGENGGQHN